MTNATETVGYMASHTQSTQPKVARQLRLLADRAALSSMIMIEGRVAGVSGMMVEIDGIAEHSTIGDRVSLQTSSGRAVEAEVVGFRAGLARALTFGTLDGIGPGSSASLPVSAGQVTGGRGAQLRPCAAWLGRVLDPMGQPLDGQGSVPSGSERPVRAMAPAAAGRARLGPRVDLGVRALDLFTTCRQGQRLGLFAGSGVGKSTMLSMLARQAGCDVAVIALVGERGREVREFIEDDLGPIGLARSVMIVATSDQSPLMRREAAYAAMTVAEHFRDAGKSVLLMMDSVTRFCLALREIGLSAGEPPATRGYPPSVFAELPRLLERAGPGPDCGAATGQITALFTVLVEGDDHNEPVADAVRGILDGHVVLDRRIGEGGRYPAVDVLRSLSRTVPGCNSPEENGLTRRARSILALHADLADLVRLGAYQTGSDPAADEAIKLAPRIEAVLRQTRDEASTIEEAFALLRAALETRHGA